jgi:multicomponent Na+:H+ antiporter subunit F
MIATIFFVTIAVLMVLTLITMYRIVLGPTTADRVVALDTMNTMIVVVLIALSAGFDTTVYIDVAIVYALLSFISTLYIAKYLSETAEDEKKNKYDLIKQNIRHNIRHNLKGDNK